MIITHIADLDRELTKEEIETLEALKDLPIEFDEDNRELTPEELAQFKRVSKRKPDTRAL